MRGAPQVGFSAAMRKISLRTSWLTGLRPLACRALESHFQYSRKPVLCHATTVLGVTRIRGFFHPDHSRRKRTQNSFCLADNRWRGRLACMERSCCRRVSSAKIRSDLRRSSFEPVFMMESTQNRRCDDALRSVQAMAMVSPRRRRSPIWNSWP